MTVSLVAGKLGAGKTTLVATIIEEFAMSGRRIVANFPLNFDKFAFSYPLDCTIIPTRPTSQILADLGRGSDREDLPGLLVIDEGSMILNARTWNDKDRDNVIKWFAMSRKLNWDIYLIIQHPSALDKQIRELFCEIYINCMRLDRIKIPIIGKALPRLHLAVGRYGSQPGSPVTERWFYRGNKKLFSMYNTSYIFNPDEDQKVYKVTAKVVKGLHWYLNQPLSYWTKNANIIDIFIIWPQIAIASVFVLLAKLISSDSTSNTRTRANK